MHRRPRLTVLVTVLLLAGCGGGLEAGPDADDPACPGVIGRLPGTLLGENRGSTEVTGAAVWGDPEIRLRCGVEAPGPTTDRCITVDGIDWVFTEPGGDLRFTLYGRAPAVELTVPEHYGRENAPGALTDLTAAVQPLPQSRTCE